MDIVFLCIIFQQSITRQWQEPSEMQEAKPSKEKPSATMGLHLLRRNRLVHIQPVAQGSRSPVIQATAVQPQTIVVAQLPPILTFIQMTIQTLVQNQKTPTSSATPTTVPIPQSVEPIGVELAQGTTPNTNHLSVARRYVSVDEDK